MLRERVITALIMAALLLALLFWAPHGLVVGVVTVVVLAGAFEWAQFSGLSKVSARIGYVLVFAIAMLVANRWVAANPARLTQVLTIAAAWWSVALIWIMVAPTRMNAATAGLAGFFVLVPTWFALIALHGAGRGAQLLLFSLLLVVAADVGAYFSGRAFGRLKLAPQVSPGKSWEGVLGGMCAAGAVAVAGAYWFNLPKLAFLALCAAVAVASVVGDLTESMCKRHVGLKDSGNLLPGHGGILDRIDSVTAAGPIFALGLSWLDVL
jgi:phosphatidate cytidylyltransferase